MNKPTSNMNQEHPPAEPEPDWPLPWPEAFDKGALLGRTTVMRVIEEMPVGVLLFDDTGKIVYTNRAHKEIWCDAGDVGQRSFSEHKAWRQDTGEALDPEDQAVARALHRGEATLGEELVIQCFDGTQKSVMSWTVPLLDENERLLGAMVVNRDITGQKLDEERLREGEARFRSTLDHLLEGVQIIGFDWRYIYVNDAAEQQFQRPRGALIGQRYTDMWPDIERTELFRTVKECLENRIPRRMDNEFVFTDGNTNWFTLSIQPVSDGVLILSVDIAERKLAEQDAHKHQRLESLGTLAGGIAHDFNNLLAGVYGYTELASAEIESPLARTFLDSAMSTIDRARGLTQQLITFSKGGAPVRKLGKIKALLQKRVGAARLDGAVEIRLDAPANTYRCDFDADQLGQVVDNIIRNADEAMPDGGHLRVSARNCVDISPASHLPRGNYVCIAFEDTGAGIAKADLPKIFDPFFTTKARGRGLGLSTAFSVIRQHDGTIQVSSVQSEGTTVSVFLPAVHQMTFEAEDRIATGLAKKPRILLMDDEHVVLETTQLMLKRLGFSVTTARDGESAFRIFEQSLTEADPFVAVILDLTVPGGWGGMETLNAIRKRSATVPVFVSSGYVDTPAIAQPTVFGFAASIRKPFRLSELKEILWSKLPLEEISM